MRGWEFAQIRLEDIEDLKRYLQDDWEPFAVTYDRAGQYYIWLKKHFT